MKRICLTVAYDGTDYHGWQYQPSRPTIEGVLRRAIYESTGENVITYGGSRTDSGVHALCNIVIFDIDTAIPADRILYVVNSYLPEDIRILHSKEVASDFHPRNLRTIKTYHYSIINSRYIYPCNIRDSHYVGIPLDIDSMREAARYLIGENDYTSYANPSGQTLSNVRIIYSIEILENSLLNGDKPGYQKELINRMHNRDYRHISIVVKGNGFLYNMVRIIVGTILEVGMGRYLPHQVRDILEARDRTKAGPTAPAKGLVLAMYELEGGKLW